MAVPASHSSGPPYTGILSHIATTTSINSIPDEAFTLVVARVPYTRQQHGILRLVNERFKDTVDSLALRLEVARQQFPEQVALRDLRIVASREALDDLAQYEAQLDHAVQRLTQCEDRETSETMKHSLFNGLRLLDYVTIFNKERISKNYAFVAIFYQAILPPKLCLLLRMTITKIYEYVVSENEFEISPMLAYAYAIREWGDEDVKGFVDALLDLARRRTFETEMLCFRWSPQTTISVLKGDVQNVLINSIHQEVAELTYNFMCMTPLADLILMLHPAARQDQRLKAQDWRFLSRDSAISGAQLALGTSVTTLIEPELMAEIMQQKMSTVYAEMAQENSYVARKAAEVKWYDIGVAIRAWSAFWNDVDVNTKLEESTIEGILSVGTVP